LTPLRKIEFPCFLIALSAKQLDVGKGFGPFGPFAVFFLQNFITGCAPCIRMGIPWLIGPPKSHRLTRKETSYDMLAKESLLLVAVDFTTDYMFVITHLDSA
jgi:hypothetical protein